MTFLTAPEKRETLQTFYDKIRPMGKGWRRVVTVDRASGTVTAAVSELPIGPPVAGAGLPHSFSPVVADGNDFLLGCDGDGGIRRLSLPPG